jgi:quinoprotein glucose dehydrogenase
MTARGRECEPAPSNRESGIKELQMTQRFRWWGVGISSLLLAVGFLSLILKPRTLAEAADGRAAALSTNWEEYGGGPDDGQYSALKQINRSNVAKLQQVWFYPAGNNGFRFGSNPIVIDDVMYVVGKNNSVVALDAATGKEIWVHDNGKVLGFSHRGLVYWENEDRSDRRILYVANNMLSELDARTGSTLESFGDHGSVDLRGGLGRDPKTIRQIGSGTPGRIFGDLILMGSATGEEYESPPGDIRAYNVITGKMAWIFHTVPHPGEPGYETWPPDAWKYIGGTNTWGEISIDEKRGIAYFPTGSPTYDFYGADRNGADLYSDCLLALDAKTGKLLWYYQTTHHDLWDYDLETGPKLLTINHNGKMVDVVAEAGKNGFLYVLDRVTGKPVWPIEERPTPKSDMPGQIAWPTQPYPTVIPPFTRQKFSADEVDPYIADPKEREAIRATVAAARNEGLYTPPDTGNVMEMPGNNGGSNWGTAAIDPSTGTFYVLCKEAPSLLKLEPKPPRRQMTGTPETQGQVLYIQNCATCHQANLKGQPPSIPSLEGVIDQTGADMVRNLVQHGMAPMPAFPDLSSADIDNLIAYLHHPEDAHVPPDILARLLNPAPVIPRLAPAGTRYWTGYGYMNSTDGLPAISPPWSTLTAYDLNAGTIKWRIPFGEVESLAEKGIHDTGSYWPRGGVVVTGGGLIFGGSISDSTMRAYDKDTGKVLWQAKLPAGPEGIPAVYEVGGREYMVISARPSTRTPVAAGGNAPQEMAEGPPPGPGAPAPASPAQTQGYYVFALPANSGRGN